MSKKKTKNNISTEEISGPLDLPEEIKKQDINWEELMELRKLTVDELVNNQSLLKSFTDLSNNSIKKDKALEEVLVGTFNSFTDIAEKVRINMGYHITMDEETKTFKDYKKGPVNMETEEFLEFAKIANNYIHAGEQISALTATCFSELLTILNKNNDFDQKEIDKIIKAHNFQVNKVNKEIEDIKKGGNNGKSKRKSK